MNLLIAQILLREAQDLMNGKHQPKTAGKDRRPTSDQWRQIKGGGSYLSQSDTKAFWGIPAGAEAQALSIIWPSGAQQRHKLSPADNNVTIVEPSSAILK